MKAFGTDWRMEIEKTGFLRGVGRDGKIWRRWKGMEKIERYGEDGKVCRKLKPGSFSGFVLNTGLG